MKIFKRISRVLLILLFWSGVWAAASAIINLPLLFPMPHVVVGRLIALMHTADFYWITLHSLGNILLGIVLAIVIGILLALLTTRISILRELILPFMSVVKATPVASFIVLALIFIGAARVPTFITVLIVLPVIWTNLDEGFLRIDPQLLEMTRLYRFTPARRLRYLILPSLRPYFISACRTSIGLAWKAGVAAEIIAMPRQSIGTMIGEGKLYLMTEDMFAWTLLVVLLSLAIEALLSLLFKRLERKHPKVQEVEEHA